MLDAITAPSTPPPTIRREDYRPPEWLVPSIELEFELGAEKTRVRSRMEVRRNGDHSNPLKLDAEGLVLVEASLDGAPVTPTYADEIITIPIAGDSALVETLVEISPAANTQ